MSSDQQLTPATIHLLACSVAKKVGRTVRIVASTGTDFSLLHKLIESGSQRDKSLNDAVQCAANGRIADVCL